jgi:uncharacterized protein
MLTTLALLMLTAPAQQPNPPLRLLSVTGDAEVKVAPNLVVLSMAVESVDKTIAKAKSANDSAMGKAIATLQKQGVAAKDLQTDQLRIEPIDEQGYAYRAQKEPTGYKVSKSLTATLRDVSKFEALLTAVLEAGANRVDGIDFQTTELRTLRDQARAAAIKAAQEKATAMAALLGLKVGKPREVSESPQGSIFQPRAAMLQNVSMNAGGGGGSGEAFAAGVISVKASVSITFDVE